jgi:K+-sensing histidine kinase KdpD
VAVAALSVFAVQWLFKFPPLIIFAGAVAICFLVLGVRPGLLALLLSALVSDFFFVEPVLTFTRHSFVLGVYYLGAAVVSRFFTRKSIHHCLRD